MKISKLLSTLCNRLKVLYLQLHLENVVPECTIPMKTNFPKHYRFRILTEPRGHSYCGIPNCCWPWITRWLEIFSLLELTSNAMYLPPFPSKYQHEKRQQRGKEDENSQKMFRIWSTMNIFPLLWLLINFIGMQRAQNFLELAQPRMFISEIIQDLYFKLNSCPELL